LTGVSWVVGSGDLGECRVGDCPGEAGIHAPDVAEEQESMRQLQGQVGPVGMPCGIVTETAGHECPQTVFEGHPER
jgi:hypothetical protein